MRYAHIYDNDDYLHVLHCALFLLLLFIILTMNMDNIGI